MDLGAMFAQLNQSGMEYGITFGNMSHLYPSGPALEFSELAREKGVHEQVHTALFNAYFSEGKNIADRNVIYNIALQAGIDPAEVGAALDSRQYSQKLTDTANECRSIGISAVPAFVINDASPVIGAQPLDVFRSVLTDVADSGKSVFNML